ncbi:MAG TPA: MATE family efflux transporter, partial [Thermoanaerobaculia bacterium]
MITWERTKTITALAFPAGIALSSTLAMSLIDLAMVRSLGVHVIAAVGLSVFANTLILAFVGGIAPAVQGMVARRRGQGSTEPRCLPLNAGLLAALAVGVPLTILCYFASPFFFSLISSDPDVARTGVPFLRALYTGIIAVGMTSAFKGHWYALERPNVYMVIVLFMNCLNFCGNYVMISGRFGVPALGATGAALSTVGSLYVGVLINFVLMNHLFKKDGFLRVKPAWS